MYPDEWPWLAGARVSLAHDLAHDLALEAACGAPASRGPSRSVSTQTNPNPNPNPNPDQVGGGGLHAPPSLPQRQLWHRPQARAMLAHMLFLCLCYYGAEANAHSNYGNTDCGSPHPPSTSGPATATAATVGPSGLESAGRAASSMTASSRSSSRLGDRWLLV